MSVDPMSVLPGDPMKLLLLDTSDGLAMIDTLLGIALLAGREKPSVDELERLVHVTVAEVVEWILAVRAGGTAG